MRHLLDTNVCVDFFTGRHPSVGARIQGLIDEIPVLPFDAQAARVFGRVRSDLERRGLVLGPYDLLIAAHALATRLVLVTDNVREFGRVQDLKLDNWRAASG